MLERRVINGTDIFIVEMHHEVILAWVEIYRKLGRKPIVISLDHHSDCHYAFRQYICRNFAKYGNELNHEELIEQSKIEVGSINIMDSTSIIGAVDKLHNDEHISFSIMAGIVDYAFVIATAPCDTYLTRSEEYKDWISILSKEDNIIYSLNLKNSIPQPKDINYIVPDNRIFVFNFNEGSNFKYSEKQTRDMVIESIVIRDLIEIYKKITTCTGLETIYTSPYILDIDLDVFNTIKSLHPDDSIAFYELIQGACAITIAREQVCVQHCRIDGENINSQSILCDVVAHIEKATAEGLRQITKGKAR